MAMAMIKVGRQFLRNKKMRAIASKAPTRALFDVLLATRLIISAWSIAI